MNVQPPERFLSIAESCGLTSIGRSSMFTLIRRGEIKARKIGARTVIPESELRAFQERLPAARKTGGMR